jgi:hypothetical protein
LPFLKRGKELNAKTPEEVKNRILKSKDVKLVMDKMVDNIMK